MSHTFTNDTCNLPSVTHNLVKVLRDKRNSQVHQILLLLFNTFQSSICVDAKLQLFHSFFFFAKTCVGSTKGT